MSQTAIPVSLLPIWPSGVDQLNPIYVSPSVGQPTALLLAIAGNESSIHFSDTCAGTIAIGTNGRTATALSITPGCSLQVRIGNFLELESPPIRIVARENQAPEG